MKLLKAIVDWFNKPISHEFDNEFEYLSQAVDVADLESKIKEIERIQHYRVNVALKRGYL
jgi:hypothetical protein